MSDEGQSFDDPSINTDNSPDHNESSQKGQKKTMTKAPEFVTFSEFKYEIERQ